MIVKTLVENTAVSEEFESEHGLCLYLETKKHKVLFDLGMTDLFIRNAERLDIDLKEIDTVVISHGHLDHGGGLETFLDINDKARIYVNEKAFGEQYIIKPDGEKRYVGLDQKFKNSDRIVHVGECFDIDDELKLFSNVKGRKMYPTFNEGLLVKKEGSYVDDEFEHEQNLIISENESRVLIAGCAHNGIVNIIEHSDTIINELPTHIIGGLHLFHGMTNESEDSEKVKELGEYLKVTDSTVYTCHCTGVEAYNQLKDIMGEQISYLATGAQIII